MKGFKTRVYFHNREEADNFFADVSKKIDMYVSERGGKIADQNSIRHAHIRINIDDNHVTILCKDVSDKNKANILRLISETM